MDLNTIINLVGSVGFPIAVSLYLLKDKKDHDDKLNETLNNFSLNLQENTLILKQLIEMLRKGDNNNDKG